MQDAVAKALNLPREKVIVYPRMSGGAFRAQDVVRCGRGGRGRRAFRGAGPAGPVSTGARAEEFQFDHFRPGDAGRANGWIG